MTEGNTIRASATAVLQQYFGFREFLAGQQEVIERILGGEELCVVMPTGAGKSLCYQLPILMRAGYGLILSPLISLMKDQVDALNAKGLRAVFLNSSMTSSEQSQAMRAIASGQAKFLYVAPERFRAPIFQRFFFEHPPTLLVVDEAHCISQWGHDFRPDYQRIWGQFPAIANVQLCAFTATATPEVREDIRLHLQRPGMLDMVSGFKRKNLSFSVIYCRSKGDKVAIVQRVLAQKQPTIIYTSSRKEAEWVAGEFSLRFYHAGLSNQERKQTQDYFSQSPCPVLVATNAFGMGIDRPDIRQVIHFNIPGSLEAYYQEAGRAGRDGEAASCILLNAPADRHIQEYLLNLNNPPPELLVGLHRYLLKQYTPDDSAIYLNPGKLLPLFPMADSESQLRSAIRILERHGIVERSYQLGGQGELSFLEPLPTLLAEHQGVQTQRSIFLSRMASVFSENQLSNLCCSIAELSAYSGLRRDQVARVLSHLNGESLRWEAIELGDLLHLTEIGRQEPLQIDLKALKKKRELDETRLGRGQSYCYTRKCRQAYIIGYFGEKIGSWHCGCCDLCAGINANLSRPASSADLAQAKRILQALELVDGEFGRRRFLGMLLGHDDSNMALHQHPSRGRLKSYGEKRTENLLNALEMQGYLQIGSGEYPCLELSRKGLDALKGKIKLELKLFSAKTLR